MRNDNKTLYTDKHYGKWVALSADKTKILDFSDDFSTLFKKLGSKDVVYIKPLNPSTSYAF